MLSWSLKFSSMPLITTTPKLLTIPCTCRWEVPVVQGSSRLIGHAQNPQNAKPQPPCSRGRVLLNWITGNWQSGFIVTRSVIHVQAQMTFNNPDFKASSVWCTNFMKTPPEPRSTNDFMVTLTTRSYPSNITSSTYASSTPTHLPTWMRQTSALTSLVPAPPTLLATTPSWLAPLATRKTLYGTKLKLSHLQELDHAQRLKGWMGTDGMLGGYKVR